MLSRLSDTHTHETQKLENYCAENDENCLLKFDLNREMNKKMCGVVRVRDKVMQSVRRSI